MVFTQSWNNEVNKETKDIENDPGFYRSSGTTDLFWVQLVTQLSIL
jgi:hypothetical protein